ncbi:hypothetical protein LCGC14_2013710 [marine sediment metagenome]|uniref:MobA-like NTP transferase domain-containing protein n=1 Tax=marine sediment metagenome TaxID=412755 RepID=A0A0F9EZP9_9ZZZZ
MLEMVVRKVLLATMVDEVCVVTPDQKIADLCTRWNIDAFMPTWEGRDVVREYYEAARQINADVIVRVTGDCPLIRPEEIDKCVYTYNNSYDSLVYNTDETTGQLNGEGSDVEVFSYEALKQANFDATGDEREHVTQYIRKNMKTCFYPCLALGIRSVNTREDYEFVCDYVDGVR